MGWTTWKHSQVLEGKRVSNLKLSVLAGNFRLFLTGKPRHCTTLLIMMKIVWAFFKILFEGHEQSEWFKTNTEFSPHLASRERLCRVYLWWIAMFCKEELLWFWSKSGPWQQYAILTDCQFSHRPVLATCERPSWWTAKVAIQICTQQKIHRPRREPIRGSTSCILCSRVHFVANTRRSESYPVDIKSVRKVENQRQSTPETPTYGRASRISISPIEMKKSWRGEAGSEGSTGDKRSTLFPLHAWTGDHDERYNDQDYAWSKEGLYLEVEVFEEKGKVWPLVKLHLL